MFDIQFQTATAWRDFNAANLDGLTIVKSKEKDRIFSRVTVDGTAKFYGADFTVLLGLIDNLKVTARIRRDSVVIATGFLNLLGKWDIDNKVCELSFDVVDQYTPVFKVWDEKVSLTGLTSNTVTLEVDSEQKEVRLLRSEYPVAPTPENNYTEGTHTAEEWVYVKEFIDFPADGWDYDPALTGDNDPWLKYRGYSKETDTTQTVTRTFKYFYDIDDLLNLLCINSDCDFDPSDFSDYLLDDSELNYIQIAHKKNIISAGEIVKDKSMSLSSFLKAMKAMFNLDWFLDDGDLKFKHPSEISWALPSFTTYPAHDLTTLSGVNWSLQKKVYSYSGEFPFKEVWQTEVTRDEDFNGLPIRYNIESEQIIEFDLSSFQTNFKAILNAENDNDPGDISDNGWAIVVTDATDKITSKTGILSGDTLINGKLALSQLHDDHFKDGRYFSSGTMNGSAETFTNIKRGREIIELTAPATIDDFNFDYLVKTQIGNCELVSVSEPCNGGFSKIKLIY